LKQTCREAVIEAFNRLESRHRRKVFNLSEIVQEVFSVTDDFAESTIRTHVSSRMCVQDRIAPNQYKIRL
jgi:hypothetical protein